ncbi:peptidase M36 [Globomyces pollinis-pini]|nr:peptidase M36 [Globomyces pollinis-pini]
MIASGINLFYVANYMHDVFYQYGFTEKTGNFQSVNTDGKGVGGDAVTIEVQSDDGTNNANFLTPPDGQSGHMNMFRFDGFTPNRDSGLANDVVMHEYGHGISSRLTGGSRQANCLGETESAGMGEGWSDAFAVYLTRTVADKRDLVVKLAEYLTPDKKGFRIFPYSTDMKVNPHTYESLMDTKERVHHIGEIWAVMLYELYWNLVDKYGFSDNWYDSSQLKGNIMALRLIVGGISIQPCNPTFITARDAILKFDEMIYKSKNNKCLIWAAFSKRGLGPKAKETLNGFKNDFGLPGGCSSLKG